MYSISFTIEEIQNKTTLNTVFQLSHWQRSRSVIAHFITEAVGKEEISYTAGKNINW